MKTIRFLRFTAAAMLAGAIFASCGKDDAGGPEPQGRALTITVAVDDSGGGAAKAGTRAIDTDYTTTFETGDAIGIYVYEGVTEKFSNKKWMFDGTSWAPATAADNIYYGNAAMTLRAYYPYDENAAALPTAAAFTVQADQSTAAGYRESDLLLADAAWNGSVMPVALNFAHAMALVEAFPRGNNDSPITSVTLQGVLLEQGGAAGSVTMFDAGDGTWRAAIPAQTFATTSQLVFDYATAGAYSYTVTGSATAAASSNFTVTTIPAALGDYYYSDGSYSTALDAARTCIGVVYWKDPADPAHGKIVSLDETTNTQWSTEYVKMGATSDTDGLVNMAAIAGITDWTTKYPPFAWVHAKNPAGTTYTTNDKGKWYLPALDEFYALYTVWKVDRNRFNGYLTSAGGTGFSADRYWSSRQADDNRAFYVDFDNDEMVGHFKSTQCRVRAVMAF